MLLNTNNLVLPIAPDNTWTNFVAVGLPVLALIGLVISALIEKKGRKLPRRVTIIGMLLMVIATVSVIGFTLNQNWVAYPQNVKSSAEKWISQRYEQHFTKPQLDQLVHPLVYPETDESNTPVVRYGSTDLVKDSKITTVQLVKINGKYKVLEVNKQSLASELPTK